MPNSRLIIVKTFYFDIRTLLLDRSRWNTLRWSIINLYGWLKLQKLTYNKHKNILYNETEIVYAISFQYLLSAKRVCMIAPSACFALDIFPFILWFSKDCLLCSKFWRTSQRLIKNFLCSALPSYVNVLIHIFFQLYIFICS